MYSSDVGKKTKRYKNEFFLKALGNHCRDHRIKRGYTIDRMYREGDQLSTSVIHRLENGVADTQISVFYRYAQVLDMPLKDLFNFHIEEKKSDKIIEFSESAPDRPKSCVPYYDIRVAAGLFSSGMLSRIQPKGWVKLEKQRGLTEYFATYIVGHSMEPSIPSGSLCLFKLYRGGSRQNRIFLISARGPLDPDTQESFVLKKYRRITQIEENENRECVVIQLLSENKNYSPIILTSKNENEINVIAEFIEIID